MARWRAEARGATALLALLAIATTAVRAGAPALRFSTRDGTHVEHDLGALRELAPERTVRVHDPYEDREVPFRALDFARVLDAAYGPAWRDEEELLFRCSDGYQPTVSVARVLEHRAWLAFARADRESFEIDKRESGELRRVPLAPFYVVWENLDDPAVRAEGDHGWPYQLESVALIRSAERFPAMAPPADAPARVHRGFGAFRRHCSRCHQINGDGGTLAQELNRPVSPVEYREADWLRRWIDDPARIIPTARMPRLSDVPDRAGTIEAILAYMQAMSAQRRAAGADTSRAAD